MHDDTLILINHEGERCSRTVNSPQCSDILAAMVGVLVGIGFHQDSVKDCVMDLAEQYKREDTQ